MVPPPTHVSPCLQAQTPRQTPKAGVQRQILALQRWGLAGLCEAWWFLSAESAGLTVLNRGNLGCWMMLRYNQKKIRVRTGDVDHSSKILLLGIFFGECYISWNRFRVWVMWFLTHPGNPNCTSSFRWREWTYILLDNGDLRNRMRLAASHMCSAPVFRAARTTLLVWNLIAGPWHEGQGAPHFLGKVATSTSTHLWVCCWSTELRGLRCPGSWNFWHHFMLCQGAFWIKFKPWQRTCDRTYRKP